MQRETDAERQRQRQREKQRDRYRQRVTGATRRVRHSIHWCHACRQVYSWGMIGVIAREGARPEFTHGEFLRHTDQLSAALSYCQLPVELR